MVSLKADGIGRNGKRSIFRFVGAGETREGLVRGTGGEFGGKVELSGKEKWSRNSHCFPEIKAANSGGWGGGVTRDVLIRGLSQRQPSQLLKEDSAYIE